MEGKVKRGRERLGESLVKARLITKEQLEKALKEQKKTGERLGQVLMGLGFVSEENIMKLLGRQLEITNVDLPAQKISTEVIDIVPLHVARRYRLIPLFKEKNVLTVVMSDPLNVFALDDLKRITGCKIEPAVSSEAQVISAIEQYYTVKDSLEKTVEDIGEVALEIVEEEEKDEEVGVAELRERAEEAPIVKLVNSIIFQAVKDKASDIHLEPDEKSLRIRCRIDGILHEIMNSSRRLQPAVLSRIKIMAALDIAEKRIPQDGRFQVRAGGKEIDIRTSVFPTVFGEKAVLRILDRASAVLTLDQLGLLSGSRERFEEIIVRPNGIILITGPTGSGKTTTLYSILEKINSMEKNIVTLEDPVEYHLDLINQTQVNPKVGMTFAGGLRSILRQDPDVIMVGEIRDQETAEIAVQAALTGHLVLSTLHTNDAPGALTRLLDMGIEPFLISSSLAGVLAQRLVRKICSECKTEYAPGLEIIDRVSALKSGVPGTFYKGEGCKACKQTGYRGRIGIFELMLMDEEIRMLLGTRTQSSRIKQVAINSGMQTLQEDGMEKVKKGDTTVEEVFRVTQEE
jgi:type IV pilus assembly protein PilB